MDVEWAIEKLDQYLNACADVHRAASPGDGWNDRARELNNKAELMLGTVERILREVDPSDDARLLPPSYGMGNDAELRVRRAAGVLRDREEAERHLAPDAPEFIADRLHPKVWQPAALLWSTGQYRVAVGQAALTLATHIKARAGSRLSDGRLMQEVFSPDPPKQGVTRLHFPGDLDDETWRSRQRGLHLLAQGAYAGIRNVSAHEDEPWSEQQALEFLAVLSVISRWVDDTVEVSS